MSRIPCFSGSHPPFSSALWDPVSILDLITHLHSDSLSTSVHIHCQFQCWPGNWCEEACLLICSLIINKAQMFCLRAQWKKWPSSLWCLTGPTGPCVFQFLYSKHPINFLKANFPWACIPQSLHACPLVDTAWFISHKLWYPPRSLSPGPHISISMFHVRMQQATSHQLAGHSFILSLAPKVIWLCDPGAVNEEDVQQHSPGEASHQGGEQQKDSQRNRRNGQAASQTSKERKFQNGKIFFQRDIMKLWTESVYCIILLSGQLGRDTEELAQRKADSPDQ